MKKLAFHIKNGGFHNCVMPNNWDQMLDGARVIVI